MGAFDFFFCGGDTAPSDNQRSDEGALVVACARPRVIPVVNPRKEENVVLSDNEADWQFNFCHGRSFSHKEKLSARQWSGIIHSWHQRFRFQKICLDGGSGGGGVFVKRELMVPQQLINGVPTECKPICDQVDGPRRVVFGDFILHIFKRGDPGIELVWPDVEDAGKSQAGDDLLKDSLLASFKGGLDHGEIGFTPKVEELMGDPEWKEKMQAWPEERRWALKVLDGGMEQLLNITVAMSEDRTKYLFTKRGARVFSSVGRDDIAYAMMYCYAAFRIWLKAGQWQSTPTEDAAAFSGSGGVVGARYADS